MYEALLISMYAALKKARGEVYYWRSILEDAHSPFSRSHRAVKLFFAYRDLHEVEAKIARLL